MHLAIMSVCTPQNDGGIATTHGRSKLPEAILHALNGNEIKKTVNVCPGTMGFAWRH